MAAIGIEANTCFGRGFDAGGFMGKFKAWVVKSAANHGPGWVILDDQSGAASPYIVISNISSPTANASRAKIVQVLLPTGTAGQIQFFYWFWWDVASHTGYGAGGATAWFRSSLPTVDAGTFSYDFRGGPEFLFVGTLTGQAAVIDWTIIDEWSYISDFFCEAESKIGTFQNPFFNEVGDSGNQISGYENLTGTLANLDANGWLYFSITSAGGSNFLFNIYKDSARTQLIGHTANFLNTSTGAKTIIADNSSGLSGNLTLSATATATTGVSCQFARITVGTGEGANFTAGKFYYAFDFSQPSAPISYFQVTGVAGDVLTVATYTLGKIFSAGSMIGAYPHRFYVYTSRYGTGVNSLASIPYMSSLGNECIAQSFISTTERGITINNLPFRVQSPNDEGVYAAMRPLISESVVNFSGLAAGMNRDYGQAKNIESTTTGGLSLYLQGRTIGTKDYLYFFLAGASFPTLIINTEALS